MSFKTVVVISKAGKAGKSTISKQLVAPMLNADWIEIETINEKGTGATMTVAGRKIDAVAALISEKQSNIVLDIGISNYQLFMKELSQLDEMVSAVDYWIIPLQPGRAFIVEGISTANDLDQMLGVDPSRIIFFPNNVEEPDDMDEDFDSVIELCQKNKMHFVDAPIIQNPVFAIMSKRETSIIDYANQKIDWDAKIQAEKNESVRSKLAAEKVLQQRVRFLAKNLRGVWANSPLADLGAEK